MMKELYEPLVDHFRWNPHDPFNPRRGDGQTDKAVQKLYQALLPIESDPNLKNEEYRELWFTLERGEPSDWSTYEEYCEEALWDSGETASREAWLREWESWFPKKTYWHLLRCNRYKDWITIRIDDSIIVQTSPDEKAPYHDELLDKLLMGLVHKARNVVDMMRTGDYEPWVKRCLPYERRYGIIQRGALWKATGHAFDEDWDICPAEATTLAESLRSQPVEQKVGRLSSLCTGQYFSALKAGYEAAGKQNDRDWFGDIPAEDGRAWYARFGDARDHTLLELDPQSPEAFEKWYENKRRGVGFDHNFEIFHGRGCSRVHMNPHRDELGWYCTMWGSITWHASDMARVWRTVNEAGIPVYVGDARALADALLGEDWVLIVPRHLPCDYTQGSYYGHEIRTAIHLFDDDEHGEAIIAAAEWQEPKLSRLEGTEGDSHD